MRKSLLLVLSVCLLLGLSPLNSAQAADAKPLAVLSFAGYNGLNAATSALRDVAETPNLPTWLEGMLQLYIEGQSLSSLDAARPWGAVLQCDGDNLSAYAFVPVANAENLWFDISDYIEEPKDMGNGVFRVESSSDDKFIFVRVTDKGWILAGDNPDILAAASDDPGKLINGMNKIYDFALQVNVSNVPKQQGQFALDMLRTQLQDQFNVDTFVPESTLDTIFATVANLDQITLGWSKHK